MANLPETDRARIVDGWRRLFDQRAEQRLEGESHTAQLNHRGHRHVVRVANLSESGAMIAFPGAIDEGDTLSLQLLDQEIVAAQVRWVRDGRVGVVFTRSPDTPTNEEG